MAPQEVPQVLTATEIDQALARQALQWQFDGQALVKEARGRDFAAALDYVNRVGSLAEARNHHPDISISWNTVTLGLRTHSAGGVTGADLALAGEIDKLVPPAT